jgi:hypothetical protein
MKRRQATASLLRTIIVLLIVSICVTQTKLSATSKTNNTATANFFEEGPAKKETVSNTQNVVKVYPDAFRRAMHVVARPGKEKQLDFLVFDINGNMVLNYKMKAGERKTISELPKGSYLYHVFCEDEYLSTGKLEFK